MFLKANKNTLYIGLGVLAVGYYFWSRLPNLNPADPDNVVNQGVINLVGEDTYISAADKIFSAVTLFTPLGWLTADQAKRNYAKAVIFGESENNT